MKTAKKFMALTTVVAALAAPSLFAEPRHRNETNVIRYDSRRATVDGRIRDIDRSRNGFVIRVAGERLEVFTTERRRLERGDVIRATGYVRNGVLYADSIHVLRDEDNRRDRNDSYLSGRVESVDRRGNVIWVEDARSRRVIAVDVRKVDDRRGHRYDVDDVRRGDRITVRGDWTRNGRFEAETLEVDRGAWR